MYNTDMATQEIITNISRVKNTITFRQNGKIKLKHYSTIILQIDEKTHKVEICLPVSPSSEKAIKQALNVYGLADRYGEICQELNGDSPQKFKREYRDQYGGQDNYCTTRYRQKELLSL